MALIRCATCGTDVEPAATACPRCGRALASPPVPVADGGPPRREAWFFRLLNDGARGYVAFILLIAAIYVAALIAVEGRR